MINAKIHRVEGPADLPEQLPFTVRLERRMPGPGGAEYWLGRLDRALRYSNNGHALQIHWVILSPRFRGQTITSGAHDIAVGLAYVLDEAQVELETVDMNKCAYVAIADAQIQPDAD